MCISLRHTAILLCCTIGLLMTPFLTLNDIIHSEKHQFANGSDYVYDAFHCCPDSTWINAEIGVLALSCSFPIAILAISFSRDPLSLGRSIYLP